VPLAQPASIGGGLIQTLPSTNFDGHQLPYSEATLTPELVDREPSPIGVEQEPHKVLVQRVREVVPDVLPAHVFKLLDQHMAAAFSGNLLDLVIHKLLEDPSYPKDFKGKGKARAAKENPSDILGNVDTSIDYAKLDANRSQGSVYRGLCLVCPYVFPPCLLSADLGGTETPS